MTYIPKEHEKYNLLPHCHKDGGEAWEYPSKLLCDVKELLPAENIMPYNFDSYEDYFNKIDSLMELHCGNEEIAEKLRQLRDEVRKMNQKEEWSILRYVGPTYEGPFGLTNGKNYYWPARKDNPVYCGVIDDEEFTSYLYPTEPNLWEILEDPTGMAYKTIYEKVKGYYSQKTYDDFMKQIRMQFGGE